MAWTLAALTGPVTSATPAASARGGHGAGGLMLAYKAPHTTRVLYRTRVGATWSTPRAVPSTSTVYGPVTAPGPLLSAGRRQPEFHLTPRPRHPRLSP